MKKPISLFLLVFLVICLMWMTVNAESNRYDRKISPPAFCPNMVITSTATGLGSFYLTVAANPDRIGGYVLNYTTHPIHYTSVYSASTSTVTGYITSTTTIIAYGAILGPKEYSTTSVTTVAATTSTVSVSVNLATTTTSSDSWATNTTTTISTQIIGAPNMLYFRDGNTVYTGPLYFAAANNEQIREMIIVEILKQ